MHVSVIEEPIKPNPSASLELLAPEILLQIVAKLPGLDTLWNLMRASPHTWRLFDEYALVITESILSGPNSVLPSRTSELIRGVILVRSGLLPFRDLRDFQRDLSRPFQSGPLRRYDTLLTPKLLATSIVLVATLRSVVAAAYHLSSLAQACLESCLVRIRDPSFKPMHAYDPPAQYVGPYAYNGQAANNVQPEDRIFAGTAAQVVDAGDPSWIEEMRALRAMWIIQLVGEIQCLIENKKEIISWPEEDIETLRRMDAVDVVRNCTTFLEEEVNMAMLYAGTLGDTRKNTHYRLPRAPSTAVSSRRTMTSPKPNKDAPVVYGFRCDNEIHVLKRGSPVPEDGELIIDSVSKWNQDEDNMLRASPGMTFFRYLSANRVMMASPLAGVKFDSFRPMGFAFWDRWRMHLLGLVWGGPKEWNMTGKGYMPYFYYFAWESILPPEEVASVKAALRETRRSRAQNTQ